MSEYCIMLYYDIKIDDLTVESHDMTVLCQDIGL